MNYLAHIFLSERTDKSILGNFLGDFVKGRLKEDQYHPEILKGIITHRKVDAYTDSHERVKECRKLISPKRRRWAGVMTDIFFDHLLSTKWNEYTDENLDDFIRNSYKVLHDNIEIVPARAKKIIPALIQNDWLTKYQSIEGISLVFERMSHRVKMENPLKGSEEEFIKNSKEIEINFEYFFPQLQDYVKRVREFL